MRLAVLTLAVGSTAALAACAPSPHTTVVVTPPTSDVCVADQFQSYVGQKSPAISLPAGTEFRHYRTGDPVTADANPARVNFEYDRTGKLISVTCG